jgi:hypothetical protein
VTFGRKDISDEYLTVARIDYQKTNKHSIFGRYYNARLISPSDFDPKNVLAISKADSDQKVQTLQFRAEAFNLPNHVNLGLPASSLTGATFGRITSAEDPRIIQFALKYVF